MRTDARRAAAAVAFLSVLLAAFAGAAQATPGSDWLPLTGTDIEVGCAWNNGCSGGYHGAGARAIDFIVPSGRPVYASGAGTITQAQGGCGPGSNGCNGSRGNFVTINHGSHSSRYLHLSVIAVASGPVSAGQLIGYSGSSGQNSVAHLHYDELTNPVNGTGKLDPGTLYACHGATRVAYPPGGSGWPGVGAFSTNLRNDGYSCGDAGPPPPPPDQDGDGVLDADDRCSTTPGDPPTGCPPAVGIPFDANGDGRVDLVHRWSGGVNTWLSNGDGTYAIRGQQAQTGYGYGQGSWFAVDANGDGRTDLVHRWSEGVNTWLSNGDGSYAIHGQQAHAGYGYGQGSWLAADANGDGRTDLVHRWSEGVNTWLSNGDGSYAIHGQQAQVGYGYGQGSWLAADANGDGRTDLVHRWSEGVNTWLSNGDGSYAIHGQQAHAGYDYGQGSWLAADANGDGRTDLVHRWDAGVNTWLSNGDGTYAIRGHQAHAGYGYSQGVWLAVDANADGRTDLVHRWDAGVNTWLSNGDGTYVIRGHQAAVGYGYVQGVWLTTDANGDGRTDLVHRWDAGVNTWLSNGDGSYAMRQQLAGAGYGYGDGQWPASLYSLSLIRRPARAPAPPPGPGAADPGAPGTSGRAPTTTVIPDGPRLLRRTVKLARGCSVARLRVSGRGVKLTFARRMPRSRCRLTMRVSQGASGRRDLLVKRDERTVRLRRIIRL